MKNDVDFMKIFDGDKLIAVLNFNEMIPVRTDVIAPLNMRQEKNDDVKTKHYKKDDFQTALFLSKEPGHYCKKSKPALRPDYF